MKSPTWMIYVSAGLFLYVFSASGALAQTSKRDFVNHAKGELMFMEFLAEAFMTSRCATPALVSTNSFVTHLRSPGSQLMLGDQVVAIDGHPLKKPGWKHPLVMRLSTIGPDDTIVMTVLRQGERIDIPTQCTDSLAIYSPQREVLRAIVEKDFDGCLEWVSVLASAYGPKSSDTVYYEDYCMLYSKRMSRRDWPRHLFEYYQLTIKTNRWDPDDYERNRTEILNSEQYFRRHDQDRLFEELESQLEASRPASGQNQGSVGSTD